MLTGWKAMANQRTYLNSLNSCWTLSASPIDFFVCASIQAFTIQNVDKKNCKIWYKIIVILLKFRNLYEKAKPFCVESTSKLEAFRPLLLEFPLLLPIVPCPFELCSFEPNRRGDSEEKLAILAVVPFFFWKFWEISTLGHFSVKISAFSEEW